ncbi:MAG TPA: competence/damage-inducible protein A [Clostridia bacterium]|nr:competence/damage-inducible protein A [Clostridia bacterium]
MKAELIAIGSELLTPFRQDTNSLYLTARLNELGVDVAFKSVVGDDREHLTCVARTALSRADILIFMGGLGPTEDDLTRECVAEALGIELRRDPDLVAELYARFAARRVKMPENNAHQADVLDGAEVLRNAKGSAPGQWLEGAHLDQLRIIILLPGPPFELEHVFETQCMPRLRAALPPASIATKVIRCAMLPESVADERAAPVYKQHPDVQTTILAGAGQVEFHLKAHGSTLDEAEEKVEILASALEEELDDAVFSSAGETLEQIVGYYLQMRSATIAVAESCTGGLVGQRLTSVAGSSRYFLGGAIVYADDMKTLFCDVPPLLIAEHGAVSKQVAIALAEGIRKRCRASIGVGVTGIAGPGGATEEKPVGLVYIAVAGHGKTEVLERKFPGDRERIRYFASQQALDMVRKKLI